MPVNSVHPDYQSTQDKWKRCRDAYAGQDAVHAAGEAYLPRLKDQSNEDYVAYVKRATFYNATYRTVSGLKGMLFRIDPQTKVPDAAEEMLDDVTMSGIPLNAFAETIAEEALSVGRVAVLVDYPPAPSGITKADAYAQNLRPKMVLYKTESLINWSIARVNNRTVLTRAVLEECVSVPVDEFTSKEIKQWRVLDLVGPANIYRVRLFQRNNDKDQQIGEDMFPIMNGQPLTYIPMIVISLDDLTPEVDDPPLIDLVNVNLSHYRTTADYEHGAHFTGLPTAVISGYKKTDESEKLYIGSTSAWIFPGKDAKASFLEFSGQGLDALAKLLDRKEAQMAVLGARMLEPQHKGVEASETLAIRRKGEESMLAAGASNIGEGIEIALRWMVEWAGLDATDVEFELNKQFYPVAMTAQELSALVGAWQSGAISFQTLFENLQEADIIDRDKTAEEEQQQIGDQPPLLAGLAASLEMGGGGSGTPPGQPGRGMPPRKGAMQQ